MTVRFASPVAASLLILPVAGYVVYQFAQDYNEVPPYLAEVEPSEQSLKRNGADAPASKPSFAEAKSEAETSKPDTALRADDELGASLDAIAGQTAVTGAEADAPAEESAAAAVANEPAAAVSPAPVPQVSGRSSVAVAPAQKGTTGFSGGRNRSAGGVSQLMEGREQSRISNNFSRKLSNSAAANKGVRKNVTIGKLKDVGLASPRAKGTFRSERQSMVAPKPADRRERDATRPEKLENRDQFAEFNDNDAKTVANEPVTTFSVDVDTASYAFVRRSLESGRMPPRDAVRVEEMINYFSYAYPGPESADEPFRASVALYPTPWNPQTQLMHIGIKGYDVEPDVKPASNLVFLIDVSGSMNQPDKLPLLKNAFRMLVGQLGPEDTVSIVTYAGNAGTVLEPTSAKERRRILSAIDSLRPGGSTAGAAGITEAYRLADEAFKEDGVNRVILATDGDFNVGVSDPAELKRLIEKKRRSGTFLSVLGFGQGNYNDALMQALAQNGNGVAAYIDSLNEAQKVLVEEASANLFPIAKDVKIQIEFNPARVSEYRLIGYETRALRNQDFNNDKVDAGDIGSGHTVTAIYELTMTGTATSQLDNRRYAQPADQATPEPVHTGEFAFVKLRYKLPDEDRSKLITLPVTDAMALDRAEELSNDMRFASAVAAFGQKLRDNRALDNLSYDEIAGLAASARGADPFGHRGAFLSLVRIAGSLEGLHSR